MARTRSGLWGALAIAVVLMLGVLVYTQVRSERHLDAGDAWITTQIQARYYADEDVSGRHIDAATRDGVVTLTGEVDSPLEHQRAVQLARDVDGVHDVVDRLRIRTDMAGDVRLEDRGRDVVGTTGAAQQADDDRRPLERLDDAWITTKVQSQYYLDTDVSGRRIDVTTAEGVVTLTGEVRTDAERNLALRIARDTEGVRSVNDQLRVVPLPETQATTGQVRDERAPAAPGEQAREARDDRGLTDRIDDGWITTKVQSHYYLDTDIRGRDVDVTTMNNVVTLSGHVRSEAERQEAIRIARETDGVQRVEDRLTVRP